jgi:hypothetical protein
MKKISALVLAIAATLTPATAGDVKPRVIVVSDIGNEPDDAESFVRFLLYANQLDVEGLVPSTSVWQKETVRPDLMAERIAAYGKVLKNLRAHDKAYPDAAFLTSLVKNGQPHYGMTHVGDGGDSDASEWIIKQADKPDSRPLWILNWGGSADLAQALYKVRKTRTPEQLKAFVSKLRVYSISDQDDAGPWARQNFPELFWIASIHAFSNYDAATWRGISGDLYADPHAQHISGPDTRLVTNEWLDANIRKGPLGELYPNWKYQMEGDTPSFLHLIARGLSDTEHPEWGGWGGRYGKVAPQYGLYANAIDRVTGLDGNIYKNNQATVWRWRKAYQNDFAARIAWSLTPKFKNANHAPVAVLNGDKSLELIRIAAKYGEKIALSAEGTADPDKNALTYKWWVYDEAGRRDIKPVLATTDPLHATLTVPPPATNLGPGEVHVILEVWDDGAPALVAYRRAVISLTP